MRGSSVLILCFMILAEPAWILAQPDYPSGYFRSPVDYGILLSGSFGEVRKNHFHSGIDIRTEGVSGKPVRAIADGYVQRINISPVGFGKAIYVVHPNGYTSVYGHLDRFNLKIGAFAKTEQYKQESFTIDMTVQPGVLPVKKGDIIAYSGNSGSSGGPHLHFEIRDTKNQETINPLLFGIPVRDNISPRIYSVKIYPFDESSQVNFTGNPLTLEVTGSNGKFSVKQKDTTRVSGKIIFGIEAFDFINDNELKTGIAEIDLFVDDEKRYEQIIDRFAFTETRYVNSIIDYSAFIRSGKKIQRSYIAPNNKLSIFKDRTVNGVISFSGNKAHKIRYVVRDVFGNRSELTFWVKSHPPLPSGRNCEHVTKGTLFPCSSANLFTRDDIVLEIPEGALYEDLDFEYSRSAPLPKGYSDLHRLHDKFTPVQTFCSLSIKPKNLPKHLEASALIVKVDSQSKFSSVGGKWENGFLKAQVREFGDYMITTDTVRPVIHPVNILSGRNISKQGTIKLKISDNLSGIKSYRGTLNGKWILMDYDAKNKLLVYSFDERIRSGKNEFVLTVRDNTGNETVYKALLYK